MDKKKLKTAAFLQFIMPGAPMIYYGDELGIKGSNDPDNRRTMLWEEPENNYEIDKELLEFYQKMIRIRHDNYILTDGKLDMKTISDKKGVIIITRELENERIIGIINISDKESEIKLQLNKNEIFDLINEQSYEAKKGELTVMIEGNSFLLLK